VTDWQIRIPHVGRNTPLDVEALGVAGRGLQGEDRQIAQRLLLDAVTDPKMGTVGDFLDHLSQIGHAGRRELLNETRALLGLPSVEAVDVKREMAATSRALGQLPKRDEHGYIVSICAAPNCRVLPVNSQTGAPEPTNVRKWWCERHRHLADPRDFAVWRPRIAYSPSGGIVFLDDEEVRQKKEAAIQRREAAEREQRHLERQAEAREQGDTDAAWAEHYRPPRGVGWQ
jgi:hypothetical protein